MNRRELSTAGAAAAGAGEPGAAAAKPGEAGPGLVLEMRLSATLGAPLEQGTWDGARRRIIPITGGVAEGPRFKGVILPGGADWQTLGAADGLTQIYARYTLRHADGTLVGVINPGVRRGPAEVMARLAAGERVDPSAYYFRASPQFEVAPGPHRWLAESTFVCVGKRWPDAVELDIYRVL